jgi:hypothetical protein
MAFLKYSIEIQNTEIASASQRYAGSELHRRLFAGCTPERLARKHADSILNRSNVVDSMRFHPKRKHSLGQADFPSH